MSHISLHSIQKMWYNMLLITYEQLQENVLSLLYANVVGGALFWDVCVKLEHVLICTVFFYSYFCPHPSYLN